MKYRLRLLPAIFQSLLLLVFLAAASACQVLNPPPKLTPVLTLPALSATANPAQLQTQIARQATPTAIPSPTPFPVATYAPTPAPTAVVLGEINPLTGLEVEDPALLRERPVILKIANWPQSLRPANELIYADIIFEYFIGHQTNHLMALYYGSDARAAGPLAPGRVIDARITEHYQANLVVASVDTLVQSVFDQALPDRHFLRGFAPCPGICTETEAQGGNTVVDTAAMRAYIAEEYPSDFEPQLSGLSFSETFETQGELANRVSYLYADFSVMDWRYNEDSGLYELWQDYADTDGTIALQKSEDRDTGEPVAFENVIILYADYIQYTPTFFDIDLREGDPYQPGLLLRDGRIIEITWRAEGYDQPFVFYTPEGALMPLKPGRSWITIASTGTRLERTVEGEWDVFFFVN